MRSIEQKIKQQCLLLLAFLLAGVSAQSQTITNNFPSPVFGAVCPVSDNSYTTTLPNNFGGCKIEWTATNGQITSGQGSQTVTVVWNDAPGTKASLKVTFKNCEPNNPNEGKNGNLEETILSVKGLNFAAFNNTVNVDFCNTTSVTLNVPRMFVPGTGGVGEPPLQEVFYSWNLPAGWVDAFTNSGGNVLTTTNYSKNFADAYQLHKLS